MWLRIGGITDQLKQIRQAFCHVIDDNGHFFLQQVCVKLWCEVPGGSGNCKTAGVPAADGTPCGNDKVRLQNYLDLEFKFMPT